MPNDPIQYIAAPTLDQLSSFADDQLEPMIRAWEYIRSEPSWALWHKFAERFIDSLKAEMQRRGITPDTIQP
jgi:hypothetical protein